MEKRKKRPRFYCVVKKCRSGEETEECIERLDAGFDPITDNWEDGMGNSCTLNGWGE